MQTDALRVLGLVQKAGYLASGEFQCEDAIKRGRAYLVIIAEDASQNTKKKFSDKCAYYDVRCVVMSSKEELGGRIGKSERSCVAVLDSGFADSILEKIS